MKRVLLPGLLFCLIAIVSLSSCDKTGGEGVQMTSATDISAFIDMHGFRNKEELYADMGIHRYSRDVYFTAENDNSGTVGQDCLFIDEWILDGTVRTEEHRFGRYVIKDGIIKCTFLDGNKMSFTVKGKSLMADDGQVYARDEVSSPEEWSMVGHKKNFDYYLLSYNLTICEIEDEYNSYIVALQMGDPRANTHKDKAAPLKEYAKSIRLEAAADGWTIEESPWETRKF